jgi:hypothetical protein
MMMTMMTTTTTNKNGNMAYSGVPVHVFSNI